MLTVDAFLIEIETFLRATGISATRFGRACAHDPNLVSDLRKGRAPSLRLVARINAFMHAAGARPESVASSTRVPTGSPPQPLLPPCDAADRAPADTCDGTCRAGAHPHPMRSRNVLPSRQEQRQRTRHMDVKLEAPADPRRKRNAYACRRLLAQLLRAHPEYAPPGLEGRLRPAPAAKSPRRVDGTPSTTIAPAQVVAVPRVTTGAIVNAVAASYALQTRDIISHCRRARLVLARQVAIYLARKLTTRSFADIARYFGNRDHTTVIHAVRKIEGRRKTDKVFAAELDSLAKLIDGDKRCAA
jgi:hypothetical protein